MGRLLEFLRRAERAATSGIGRWRVEVSKLGDSLATPQFLQVNRVGSDQAGVTGGTDIILNNVAAQQGIPYDTSTGIATLTAGKTYRLSAHGSMTTFAAGTDEIDLEWVDASTNAPLVANLVGMWKPVSNGLSVAPSEAVQVIFTPASNQTVKLRCTSSSGTASVLKNFFSAIIQQVGA